MKSVILSVLLFAFSLAANPSTTDVFSLSTTPCFGTCPVYEVNVFSDGVIVFNGEAHTELTGIHRLPKDSDLFQNIIRLLDSSDFQTFRDNYGWSEKESPCQEQWTDHPSTVLSLQYANTKKTIYHYHGCKGFDREEELEVIEDTLFELIGLKSYVGG
ncbi:DUF6438 domain-containing protein [Paraglaciecola sp. 2405UD69-4]|uniref:DUF6438 domain-containing protein n=1 Tax=Paraglaciecola sp. 2405UD69-4 TaxID=3391836 RepID=UPI0039C9F196